MDLESVQRTWDAFGETDPMTAVLTEPDKAGNRWNPNEFFATGVRDVREILEMTRTAGLSPRPGRALDFGCGVGRLSQALGDHFDEVHGVDIAPSMLEKARRFNRHGNKCTFHLNSVDNLRLFSDNHFDFVCSLITLQHIEPRYSHAYLNEMVRVLARGGVLVFQLPAEMTVRYRARKALKNVIPPRIAYVYRLLRYGAEHAKDPQRFSGMEMYGTPRHAVERLLRGAGGTVAAVVRDRHAGNWVSYRYFVTKT